MDDHALTQWLLENGGPAIRYRTATELMDAPADIDLDALAADLTSSSMVRRWIGRIGQPGGMTSLHASDPAAFENVCAKLCELGLREGSVQHLEAFRTDQGSYRFPRGYLLERASGYWVTGAYMRLEENRRVRRSLDLDSTFRMCAIESLARGKKQ